MSLPGYVRNYSENFTTELNNIFCYSVYSHGENYIVKLKADYIKHNTTVQLTDKKLLEAKLREIAMLM